MFCFINISDKGDFVVREVEIKEGGSYPEDLAPTFACVPEFFMDIVRAFIDCADEENIEKTSESELKGKMKAMEQHISDLRKMLKLND